MMHSCTRTNCMPTIVCSSYCTGGYAYAYNCIPNTCTIAPGYNLYPGVPGTWVQFVRGGTRVPRCISLCGTVWARNVPGTGTGEGTGGYAYNRVCIQLYRVSGYRYRVQFLNLQLYALSISAISFISALLR